MTEEFLHHVWKFKLFDQFELVTTTGEPLEILKAGEHNTDSGPDFFTAKIRIGENLWVGNIEVHIHSDDWQKHHHQNDTAYDNIILHVVHQNGKPLFRKSGEQIPTLVLKDRIDEKLYASYLRFKTSNDWMPCQKLISSVPRIIVNSTIDRLLLERLERKSEAIKNSLTLNKNNWEETFYQMLARNFGFKTNAEPFEILAKSLPSLILAKHKNNLIQVEALLLGQAGLLEEHYKDKYLQQLQNEYVFLQKKFKLKPMDKHLWKFLRLRPVNFPTIRIAQFAHLVYQSSHLFSKIIEVEKYTDIHKLMNAEVSDYWQTHYTFDKCSTKKSKALGTDAIHTIIINTIVPFLFVYGKANNDEKYTERALKFLEQTTGESNSIITGWKQLEMSVKTAYSTQALLQLKNEYCNKKKCLNCPIGNYLLKNS